MKKAQDFRDQSLEELEANCRDARKELFNLINEMKQTKKVEKPHLVRHKKREIALLLTVINEKKQLAK
ncbi:MAG: 50S ribosomal protein L29 [Chlamydiales bacterium 38-26]|nr:50S ribosomal protein L29 [Chlamydiales bacterium]OJV07889.1 MAG: 50S ribosomal protein L29 [Chlamydiales bacterium 38-26]